MATGEVKLEVGVAVGIRYAAYGLNHPAEHRPSQTFANSPTADAVVLEVSSRCGSKALRLGYDCMTITARLTLAMVLLALLTAAMVGILTYRKLEAAILPVELSRLQEHASGQATLIDEVIAAARHDVRAFTNGAAAFDGISRARSNGGIDPQDGATEQLWRERLARRFVAELQAKSDYVQMRFIGLADGGREIVRVGRSGPEGQIRIIPEEELQRKGSRLLR